ncbi:MAG: CsbD family protein [Acidimicrobiaceae bacterium]|nr:CsbD family protein [Acidimicrobiaceae bacterium]
MSSVDKSKNKAQITKGKIKASLGKATRNDKLMADGQIDQLKGHVKQAGEKVKDAFKK